jgi:putative membrane protein
MIQDLGFHDMYGMPGGLLLMVVIWLAPVLIVAIAAWQILRQSRNGGGRRTARRRLDERYARGEIDRDTYLTTLADLERTTPSPRGPARPHDGPVRPKRAPQGPMRMP